jgi:hypothetical protein
VWKPPIRWLSCASPSRRNRSFDLLTVAEPQAPVRRTQSAAQIGVDDADELVDLVIRHFRLAETLDERGAFERFEGTRDGGATSLHPLDEIRLQRGGAPSGSRTFEGFAQVPLPARPDLNRTRRPSAPKRLPPRGSQTARSLHVSTPRFETLPEGDLVLKGKLKSPSRGRL